jgi:DNA-directed RNA polymerase specialized sigma24 family protein
VDSQRIYERNETLIERDKRNASDVCGAGEFTRSEVMQALGRLDEKPMQVLAMNALGGMKCAQIAAAIGESLLKVRAWLREAVMNMRAMRVHSRRSGVQLKRM